MATLNVSTLARQVGIRPDTLRYYERVGLLPPPLRSPAGYRQYDPAIVERLRFIRGAQQFGLRLREIADLLAVRDRGACPCGHAEALVRQRISELDAEMGVAPLQGLADLGSCRSGGMGGDPPARVQGGRQRWASCPGALEAAGRGGTGAGRRTTGPRAARFSPEDHNGGDAYIGYLAFNGEFLAANAAPAAGYAIPVGRMVVPAGGWSGPQRSPRSAPCGAAAPRPTAEPLVSQVRQSLQTSYTDGDSSAARAGSRNLRWVVGVDAVDVGRRGAWGVPAEQGGQRLAWCGAADHKPDR